MSITAPNFSFRLSGGAANANANASLGGAKSSVSVATTLNGLFDVVTAAEALAGSIEYRCIYLHNANATDVMQLAKAWIDANTPSTSTTLAIGVGTSAVNGVEQTVANETTAPTGVTFSEPATAAAGLALGDIPGTQSKALWLRRTVTAGAASIANDTYTIGANCETV